MKIDFSYINWFELTKNRVCLIDYEASRLSWCDLFVYTL
jgi:hypothetical protein